MFYGYMKHTVNNNFNKYKKISETQLSLIIFILLVVVQLPWIDINGIILPDSKGYIDVSINWINSDYIYIRPFIYPLFIYISNFFGSSQLGILIYIQIIFYAFSGVLFFKILILQKVSNNKQLLCFLVLISFLVPQSLQMNQVVLPEMLPLFFVLLLFYFLLKPIKLMSSFIISILIIIPILMKPLWLLLLAFPFIKYIYSNKSWSNFYYCLLIPTLLVLFFYSTNQYLVAKNNKRDIVNKVVASVFDININLALIRLGLIDGSEGTKLYSYLYINGLIPEISNKNKDIEFDNISNFNQLKNQIPRNYREDGYFWKSILIKKPQNLLKFVSFQVTRLPIFFATSAENSSVDFLYNDLNAIYQRFYSNIHSKHIVGILFSIFAFIIGVFNFKELTINKLLFFLILGVAIILCLLTYQDSHFLRMRAVIEPMIIYVTLFTSIRIFKILNRYNMRSIILYYKKNIFL
tara:strand:+ start:669 stop:2060 length:1392 start_codon:yes stop_codon:yes gene_type:complete